MESALFKYVAANPFVQDDKPVIRFGDTIIISEDNKINNLTSGKIIYLDKINGKQEKMFILQNSSRMEDEDLEAVEDFSDNDAPDSASIPAELFLRLREIGILDDDVRSNNVGTSDYSRHLIQPWTIWKDYNLDPWDADIIKRVLRTKRESGKSADESRVMDYQKIIHICQEKIRQLTCNENL